MPQVPRYDSPTVGIAPVATPQATPLGPDAFGAGLGQGLSQLGGSLDTIAKQAKQQADQKFITDSMTAADAIDSANLYGDDENMGFLQLRGMDAVDRSSAYLEDTKARYDKLRENATDDYQRQLFDHMYQSRMESIQKQVLSHSNAQWLQAGDDSRNLAMKSTLNMIGNTWNDDQAFSNNVDKLNLLVDQEVAAKGLDPNDEETATYKADRKKEIFAQAFSARINRMMVANPMMANDFLQANKDQMDSSTVAMYERELHPKVVAVESTNQSNQIWDELGPENDYDPIDIDAMQEEARKRITNPDILTATLNDLQHRMVIRQEGEKNRLNANEAAVWKSFAAGKSLTDVMAMPEYAALPGSEQEKVREHITTFTNGLRREARAEARADRAESRQSRAEARLAQQEQWDKNYLDISTNPDRLATMTNDELGAMYPYLGHNNFAKLEADKKRLTSPEALAQAKIDTGTFNSIMAQAGITDKNKLKLYYDQVQNFIVQQQKGEGRKYNQEDIRRAIIAGVQQVDVNTVSKDYFGSGWSPAGVVTKRRFEVQNPASIVIPQDVQVKLDSMMTSRGVTPTQDRRLRLYDEMLKTGPIKGRR